MLWLHDRRAEEDGGVADTVRYSHGRPAIHGSVLDCGLRHFGSSGSGSVSGECARDEESDMTKWKTENHFVSWLKLSPDNKIRGGKIIGKGRMPTNNRATTVLRMAATTLRDSDSYLGAQFRRFRTRLGPPVATKAMAAKLARLIYRMLRFGMKYADRGAELYDAQYRKQQVIHLKRKAAQLGLQIIELAPAP